MAWNRNLTCQNDKLSISSSTEFVRRISTLQIKYTNAFASLDIKGLYTQIQLNEVIEDI